METVALVAPVTALDFIRNEFLLSGEGPVLTIFNLHTLPKSKVYISQTVLHHQRIHGIRPRNLQEGGGTATSDQEHERPSTSFYDMAVFGGKAVRLVRLHLEDFPRLEVLSPIMELHDWILDVCWMSDQIRPLLCVALAHNSALLLDSETGITLHNCSCSEGCLLYSSLVLAHESWSDTVLIGGTVFNQLIIWKTGAEANAVETKAKVERRLMGHSGVIFAITYLRKEGVIASASDDRSVRIWQVGNLGGTDGQCGDDNPVCLHVLYGHQARVFSVKLLDGKVFSAGEDGACLVWENGKVVQTLKGHRAGGVRALAICFKSCEKVVWVATGGADGGVRLWRLGVKSDEEEGTEERLIDLKFPTDKMDNTGVKTQVEQKEDGLKTQNVQCQHEASPLNLSKVTAQADISKSEINIKTDRKDVNVGNLPLNTENSKTQEKCDLKIRRAQVYHNVEGVSEQKSKSGQKTEKTSVDLDIVGVGVPKVICTLDSTNEWSDCSFVVCTDKGCVYQYKNKKWEHIWQGPPEFQSYCVMEAVKFQINGRPVHLCAVGNISGSVQVFPVADQKSGMCLEAGKGKLHSLVWCKERENGGAWLLASGSDGLVYRWWVSFNDSGELEIVGMPCFELPNCAKRWLTAAVRVEFGREIVWVCGDRRGSLLLFWENQNGAKILEEKLSQATHELMFEEATVKGTPLLSAENRRGSFQDCEANAFDEATCPGVSIKLTPVSILFGVHGKQGVTSVVEHEGLFYSTGRDGCVRIFQVCSKVSTKLQSQRNLERLEQEFVLDVFRVQRACKGMEWLEKIMILDTKNGGGSQLEMHIKSDDVSNKVNATKQAHVEVINSSSRHNVQETRFAIVGFHGNHFVVWDPVCQEKLLSVLCGGGHRSWSLWTCRKGHWAGNGALVFIKQGTVLSSESSLTETSGKLSWTLREGMHGRGIGCICRLGHILGERNDLWEVSVSGGEDTSMTVFALNPKNGNIKVLAVLTDHISSVRALTAVVNHDSGTKTLSALVMSAGGRAQMLCYRLLIGYSGAEGTPSCRVIQVAGHRLDEQWERKRNRHKMVKMDPETRYMSMAVLEQTPVSVTLAVACSDGAIRLFSVIEVKHHIKLLCESFHHQRCVLSVAACCLYDAQGSRYELLFSAATDGQIAMWCFKSPSCPRLFTPSPIFTFPAHQSGVNSLDIKQVKLNGFDHVAIASGGDDGQLTVSIIKIQFGQNSADSELQKQPLVNLENKFSVQLAHAAPLTSLKLLTHNVIASTSCDQRVCLWRVSSAGISHQRALCSHVADAAALAVWEDKCDQKSGSGAEVTVEEGTKSGNDDAEEVHPEEKGEEKQTLRGFVLVCGQGLQLIRVTL